MSYDELLDCSDMDLANDDELLRQLKNANAEIEQLKARLARIEAALNNNSQAEQIAWEAQARRAAIDAYRDYIRAAVDAKGGPEAWVEKEDENDGH